MANLKAQRLHRFKFFVFFLLIHICVFNTYMSLSWYEVRVDLPNKQEKYKWLDITIYELIQNISNKEQVDSRIIFPLIQAESNGRNIISQKRYNGTRDYGIMQINSCHVRNKKDAKKLLHKNINIYYGVKYLKKCLVKSDYNYMQALRMYNQGMYSNEKKYNNWKYVAKILNEGLIYDKGKD
jgi:soluble lytic murein transglycosylase-like protein